MMDKHANMYPLRDDEDIDRARKRLNLDDVEAVNPRASDLVLHADLKDAGLIDLAVRAARGEWNDYFGKHALPQHHLAETLKARIRGAEKRGDHVLSAAITRIALAVIEGKYDGTRDESAEWAAAQGGEVERVMADPRVKEAAERLERVLQTDAAKAKIAEIEKAYVRDVLT